MATQSEQWLQWYPGALSLASHLLRGAHTQGIEPKDIVQTAYLRACQSRRLPIDQAAQRAWLLKVVRNACFDVLRGTKKVSRADHTEQEPVDTESWCGSMQFVQSERAQKVREAMATLPLEMREILALRELNDLAYDEIASILSIEKGTVMSRLHRARMALRASLLDWYEEEEMK